MVEGEEPQRSGISRLLERRSEFLSFVEKRIGNRATAEDILQEAFSRGIGHVESLRNDETVIGWFYRVLRNAVIDHYRRSASASTALARFAAEVRANEEAGPEIQGEICKCIARLASDLKPDYAEALQMVEIEDAPVKDFAEKAGISAGNARVRLFRAREALRKRVIESCAACATHGCTDCDCQRGR